MGMTPFFSWCFAQKTHSFGMRYFMTKGRTWDQLLPLNSQNSRKLNPIPHKWRREKKERRVRQSFPFPQLTDSQIKISHLCMLRSVQCTQPKVFFHPLVGPLTRRSHLEKRQDETRRDEAVSISSRLVTSSRETVEKKKVSPRKSIYNRMFSNKILAISHILFDKDF